MVLSLETTEWVVNGKGFHRDLQFSAKIQVPDKVWDHLDDVAGDKLGGQARRIPCELMIQLDFARTAYVDMDEVDGVLRAHGELLTNRVPQVSAIGFEGTVDVERPAEASNPFSLAVQIAYGGIALDDSPGISIHMTLPVHLRYQSPSMGTLFRKALVVDAPVEVWLGCRDLPSIFTGHIASLPPSLASMSAGSDSSLRWAPVRTDFEQLNPIELEVPVGQLHHENLVTLVTAFATLGCALLLSWVMLRPVSSKAKIA